ncbi:MAG: T9SS type A sorting domain-containing protein [candidate division WOR-3 bacterium]|nr:MAG: T9SS type A sorting domain-containing protein [candidate division WOR-3 bacterium]
MNSNQHKPFAVCIPYLLVAVVLWMTVLCAQVTWTEHIIDPWAYGTASIYVADLDNDCVKDVLGAVLEEDAIEWWRYDGSPSQWTKFNIDTGFFQAISVYAADIDNDGDQDVIGAASYSDEIAWWRNDGGNPIQWTKYVIRSAYDFAHEVYAHDLNKDGRVDVLGASSFDDLISWWRNDGGNPITWTEQTIGYSCDGAKSVRVADFDDDGDNDVVGANLYDNRIIWWRNDGGDPIQWTEFTIDSNFAGAHRVQAIDLDLDQDEDILAVAYFGHEIAWYRNDGGNPLAWTKQTIGTDFVNACIAQAADLDGDGDLDVAATAQTSDEVAWWRNDGGNPIVWTKFFIEEYFDRAWPLYVCDLDGDEDKDVIAGSSWAGIHEVRWWENTSTGIAENQISKTLSQHFYPTIIRSAAMLRARPGSKLYDIMGREINTSHVTPGVYFVETDDQITSKIIVVD